MEFLDSIQQSTCGHTTEGFDKVAVQGPLDQFRERLRSWVYWRTEAPQKAISCNDTEALPLNHNAATDVH